LLTFFVLINQLILKNKTVFDWLINWLK